MLMHAARITAGAVVAGIALAAIAAILVPRALGMTPYVVTSGSMTPTFRPGDLVISAPIRAESIQSGDILTFMTPGGLTTHRVIEAASSTQRGRVVYSFTTKGDANEDVDPSPLDSRNVVGKATIGVPYLGHLVRAIQTPVGAGSLAALFLFVVFTGGRRNGIDTDATSSDAPRREAVRTA